MDLTCEVRDDLQVLSWHLGPVVTHPGMGNVGAGEGLVAVGEGIAVFCRALGVLCEIPP